MIVRRPLLTASALFAAVLVWAGRLVLDSGPWAPDAATLLAVDLVVLAAVSLVGMLVAGSRWARRLGVVLAAATIGLAVAFPIDTAWILGLVASAGALGGLVGTGMKGIVRERPAAAGPPNEAVLLPLVLLSVPALVGVVRPAGLHGADWAVAGVSLLAAAVYVKAWRGALPLVRVVAPGTIILGGLSGGMPAGLGLAAAGIVVARLAWTIAARVAVRPLVETGSRVPVPAELAPHDILEAAGLDERGRRRTDLP